LFEPDEWIDAYTRIRFTYSVVQDQIEWYREDYIPVSNKRRGFFVTPKLYSTAREPEADA